MLPQELYTSDVDFNFSNVFIGECLHYFVYLLLFHVAFSCQMSKSNNEFVPQVTTLLAYILANSYLLAHMVCILFVHDAAIQLLVIYIILVQYPELVKILKMPTYLMIKNLQAVPAEVQLVLLIL